MILSLCSEQAPQSNYDLMEIINDFNISLRTDNVVTIGFFDGFHKGHQKIAGETISIAKKMKIDATLITFRKEQSSFKCLSPLKEKLKLIHDAGFDRVVILKDNNIWRKWSPEEFIERFLIGSLNTKYIIVGSDFRFGRDRIGDIRTLGQYSSDFETVQVALEYLDSENKRNPSNAVTKRSPSNAEKISSSKIREFLKESKIKEAEKLLGRHYFFTGDIVPGENLAAKTGFPTLNFKVPEEKLMPEGVFIAEAIFKKKGTGAFFIEKKIPVPFFGACFIGRGKVELHLVNMGTVPISGDSPHLFEDIAGARLIEKIRDVKKFETVSELKKQIKKDIEYLTYKKL